MKYHKVLVTAARLVTATLEQLESRRLYNLLITNVWNIFGRQYPCMSEGVLAILLGVVRHLRESALEHHSSHIMHHMRMFATPPQFLGTELHSTSHAPLRPQAHDSILERKRNVGRTPTITGRSGGNQQKPVLCEMAQETAGHH